MLREVEGSDDFAFDVFLSYSRKDEAFVRLLEKTLRGFRPPKGLDLPPRYLRVFRDASDLVGNDLTEALESNLARSARLLVICSPASLNSRYVGLEIQRFAELRGKNNIIALLYCDPSQLKDFQDDAPEKLFRRELVTLFSPPLAEDYRGFHSKKGKLNKGKFQNNWLGILARIYGKEKSEVERRERKRQANARRIRTSILFAVIVALAALAIWALVERGFALRLTKIALSRQLAAQSIEASSRSLDLALLLSLQAVTINDSIETEDSLGRNIHLKGPLKQFLSGHDDTVWGASFSPDGSLIASASQDRSVIIWDSTTGRPIGKRFTYRRAVRSVMFSPDGKHLVTGDEAGDVVIRDLRSGIADTLPNQHAKVLSVAYSPDGCHLATAASDGTIVGWNLSDHKVEFSVVDINRADEASEEVRTVAYSPDGKLLASGAQDGNLRLWDAHNGTLYRQLFAHAGGIQGVAFSPNGRLIATGGDNGQVKLWDVDTGTEIRSLPDHRGKVYALAFVQDGSLIASAGEDQKINLDDVATGAERFSVSAHEGAIYGLASNRQGSLLASTSFDRKIILWNVARNFPHILFGPQSASVRDIAFSPDGEKLVSVNWVGEMIIWNRQSGRPEKTIKGHSGESIYRVAYSPDGQFLATAGADNKVILWDAHTYSQHKVLSWHSRPVRSLAFSPDTRFLASGDRDGKIAIWDLSAGRMVSQIKGHKVDTAVYSVAFSPDSKLLASAGFDRQVILHDVQSGATLASHSLHTEAVRAVTFSPDGKTIASGGVEGSVVLWDFARDIKRVFFHGAGVGGLAYSPDGKTLVSVGDDRNVTLWDAKTGTMIVQLKGHEAKVQAVAFSPENPFLIATASRDKDIRLWNINVDDWRRDGCVTANRNLTCAEWAAFVGVELSYQRTCATNPYPPDWSKVKNQCIPSVGPNALNQDDVRGD